MSQHFVAHDGIGYHVWRLVNGRYRLNVGPHFATPREAMAYADSLDSSLATRPAHEQPLVRARLGSPVAREAERD